LNKEGLVDAILGKRSREIRSEGSAFAPANIALCKYWGKRNEELNLPVTSSLSVSLGSLGTNTTIQPAERDAILFNGDRLPEDHPIARRLLNYVRLLRGGAPSCVSVVTRNSIPTGAGLASSASGFAALVKALDQACGWELAGRELSILARLGSGSATRSIFSGFVEWQRGTRDDGMDCYAEALGNEWPALRMGILAVSVEQKRIGSTAGMKQTTAASPLYQAWPGKVAEDLPGLRTAIEKKDFQRLGETAESNALAMHATMISARPPVLYWHPESVGWMHRIWDARRDGLPAYFTMDAGPNIKLIYLKDDEADVKAFAPEVRVVDPWTGPKAT
jgi:diphosphomevalonate decarboxylase